MSSNETAREALTPARAAAELGVSIKTLHRWESAGKISAFRTVGGQRRFDRAEVERVKTAA